jgi:hypothetical protein
MVSLINKLVNVKVFVDRYLLNLTVIYTKVNAKMDKKETAMVVKFTVTAIIISVIGKMIKKMEKAKKFM